MRHLLASLILLATFHSSTVSAVDEDTDVAKLQQQNELLQAKLEAANLKIEKLEKQLADLKAEGKPENEEKKPNLLLVDSEWAGQFTRVPSATEKSVFATDGRLVVTELDGESFVAQCSFNNGKDIVQVDGTCKKSGSITFKYTKVIAGDFPKDAIGSVFKGKLLRGTEMRLQFFTPGTNRTGTFNLKLKEAQ